MKKYIKRLLREGLNKVDIEDFYKKHNIDSEELSWLGSGDFGNAYETEDSRVVKITTSKSEFSIAKQLIGKAKQFSSMAEIYDAADTKEGYIILQELLNIDSDIENLYYEMSELLETQGLPPQYVGNFDEDEYEDEYGEISEELKEFINGVYGISVDYRNLGIMASDIRPENMGYDDDGNLKAFDIDDRMANESITNEEIESISKPPKIRKKKNRGDDKLNIYSYYGYFYMPKRFIGLLSNVKYAGSEFINFKKGIKSIGSDKICDNSYFSMHHMDKEKFVIAGSYGSLSNNVETEVIKENFIDFLIDKLKEFNSGENINNDNINRNIIQIHEFGSFWVKYGPLEYSCITE